MWSSQRFLKADRASDLSADVLKAAVATYQAFQSAAPTLPPLLTLRHLSLRSDTDYFALRRVITGDFDRPYRHFFIRKRSGASRAIHVPNPQLMIAQKWIARHILNNAPVHEASRAFSPKSSIYKCAAQHCNAKWLIKMDISNFFDNVSEIQCYRVFKRLGYQPLVAFELARLCTLRPNEYWGDEIYARTPKYWRGRAQDRKITAYESRFIGWLPQGAPTSPMLANLAMVDIDAKIAKIAVELGLRYTRYSDDLTFSTESDFDRGRAELLIQKVATLLKSIGLELNRRKTRVVPPGPRKLVLGLLVDGPQPRLTRQYKDRIRQHLYYIEKLGFEAHVIRRGFDSIGGLYRHLRGLVDFANMVEPIYAADALTRLQRALPAAYTE